MPDNQAPTLTVTESFDFAQVDGASENDLVATFTTADEDGDEVTVTLSDMDNYALSGNTVVLTEAGAALVNAGEELPAFTLTPSDAENNGTAVIVDPEVTLPENQVPTLTVTDSFDFAQVDGASENDLVATFTTADEDGDEVSVTLSDMDNYALSGNTVVLTEAGAALVNAGEELPAFTLTPSDAENNGTAVIVDPEVTLPDNQAPTLTVTDSFDFAQVDGASENDLVATFTTADEDGDEVTVTLSDMDNYALSGNTVVLTETGAALVNAGEELPAFTLTPSDAENNGTAVMVDPAVAPDESIMTATFADGVVNGLSYSTTSGLSGLTGEGETDGAFSYRDGDTITFSVGGVEIAEISSEVISGSVLFLQDIAKTDLGDVNLNYVENMAIFIQAISEGLQDSDVEDGVLDTSDIINHPSGSQVLNITSDMRAAFDNYDLNIAEAGKQMISDALAHVNIEFTRESETEDNLGHNEFETAAMEHVAQTIESLAGDRTPDSFDERTADVIEVPGGVVQYNYSEMNGQVTFTTNDLLEGAVGQQVTTENLLVKNVQLSAQFQEIGTLVDQGDGNYLIQLNEGINQYDLEGLSIDYRVEDWTAYTDVTSSTLDTFKSHLSTDVSSVSEGDGYNQFSLNSTLTFDTAQTLKITFTSEKLSAELGKSIAEYSDDYTMPVEYSTDGGDTWMAVSLDSVEYQDNGDVWPTFSMEMPGGSNAIDIRIPIFDDYEIEGTEYFNATVSGDNYYDEDITFAIEDNDSAATDLPLVGIDFVYAVEGQEYAEFTVSLSKAAEGEVSVDYTTIGIGATAGVDFTDYTGTVTFAAGETSKVVRIGIEDDTTIEDMEMGFVTLSNVTGDALLGDAQGTLRIFDNDGPANLDVTLTIDDVTSDNLVSSEEAEGSVTITGTVSGDAFSFAVVTLNINGQEYSLRTDSTGKYQLTLDASELTEDADLKIEGTAHAFDSSGNRGDGSTAHIYEIDVPNDVPEITVTNVNVFTEDQASADEVVAEFTTFDADGDDVTVTLSDEVNYALNGNTVVLTEAGAALVNAGEDLPSFTLTPNDGKENGQSAFVSPVVNIDTEIATPTISFEDAGTDQVYNNDEVGNDGTVTATISVTGSEVGDTLTYKVNDGEEVTIELKQNHLNNGVSFEVSPEDSVTASLSDEADNKSPDVTENAPAADIDGPSVTITAADENLSVGQETTVTFQFSENVAGFEMGDIKADGGELSNLQQLDDDTWTATFTFTGDKEPSISVAKNSYTDTAGNKGSEGELTLSINDAPEVTLSNQQNFTEEQASAGDVVASYSTNDEDGDTVTVTLSDTTNYALDDSNNVVLTEAGAALVNGGSELPAFTLTPHDGTVAGEAASYDPSVTLVNDGPVIEVTAAAEFNENDAAVDTVVASFTASDEEDGTPSVDFTDGTNTEGYYAIDGTDVVLTQAGVEAINAGETLPAVSLTATDSANVTDTDSDTPSYTAQNDGPVIEVTAAAEFNENDAAVDTVVASFTASDEEDGTPSVDFTDGTNTEGYYAIDGTDVVLTQAGVEAINAGETLPAVSLTATDSANVTDTDSDTPTYVPENDAPEWAAAASTTHSLLEGESFAFNANASSLLSDFSDEENETLTISSIALDSNGTAVTSDFVDGYLIIESDDFGVLKVASDGSYKYEAPIIQHSSDDAGDLSFTYKVSDGSNESEWASVFIDIRDQGLTGVDDIGFSSVEGNVLNNDTHTDSIQYDLATGAGGVTSISYGSGSDKVTKTLTDLNSEGNWEVQTDSGTLTMGRDGGFSFAVNTLTDSSATGFQVIGFDHGASLSSDNDGAFFSASKIRWSNDDVNDNVKETGGQGNPKIGVGSNSLIDWNGTVSETLLVKLDTVSTAVQFGVHNMNGIDQSEILAFDSNGDIISGITVTENYNNGNKIESVSISAGGNAISYVSFSNSQENSNNDGFSVQEIESLTPAVDESFTYTFEDSDGSQGSALLQITDKSDFEGMNYSVWSNVNSYEYGGNYNGSGGSEEQLNTVMDNVIADDNKAVSTNIIDELPSDLNYDADDKYTVAHRELGVISAFIYLEEGKEYSFEGTVDDSFYVSINDTVVASARWGADGYDPNESSYTISKSDGSFVAQESGYHAIQVVYHNQENWGHLNFKIAVDDNDAVELNTDNFDLMPMTLDGDLINVLEGASGKDDLEGGSGVDALFGNDGDDLLFGGDDTESDTLIGGSGADVFILNESSNDSIQDFHASEDALDISDLLDLPGNTDSSDLEAVQAYLDENVAISQDGDGVNHLTVKGSEVATFGSDSSFDSDGNGSVNSTTDSLTVIFNNQEFTINQDG
ncbi:Poly(beta-D-mannuronate) C5 epimerase 2 [Marinomonas aquimarina]|uniref:Poly(Beta-D-mannuronate) C5 epimerase 2 n=1 Tax=Marinomonas aquimarina TaxID=295068 RepID=A0A1A8T8T0_9GAMM|nr:Poly(beta-D-mannuronate) C5 epimerase 2 [Marinomonas aquimarina]